MNLAPKHDRDAQSHDIAKRVRPALVEIAKERGASVKVVEIPPGPPVLDTMVAEIYGPTPEARHEVAMTVRGLFETTAGVVDVHDSMEAERERVLVSIDREKAGLKGIPAMAAVETLAGPGAGREVARIDAPVLARAGARCGCASPPPTGRAASAASPCGSTRRWAGRSRSASSPAWSGRPSPSPWSART